MSDYRLGDDLDDFCVKCKRITNHSIVSLVNEEPAKVRCRTCYSDHDFRRCEAPPSKKDLKKQQLFNEVLSTVKPGGEGEEEKAEEAEEATAAEATTAEAQADEEPAAGAPAVEEPKAKKGGRRARAAK